MNTQITKASNAAREATTVTADLSRQHIVALDRDFNAFTNADAKAAIAKEINSRLYRMGYGRNAYAGTLGNTIPTRPTPRGWDMVTA